MATPSCKGAGSPSHRLGCKPGPASTLQDRWAHRPPPGEKETMDFGGKLAAPHTPLDSGPHHSTPTPSLTTHCIPVGPSRPLTPQLLSLVQETLHPGSAPALTCPVTPLHHVTHSNCMQAPKPIIPLAFTHVVLSSLNVFPHIPVPIKFGCIL